MVTMTGHVISDFAGAIPDDDAAPACRSLLALVPFVLAILLRRLIVQDLRMSRPALLFVAAISAVTIGSAAAVCRFGPNAALYTYDYNADSAVSRVRAGRQPPSGADLRPHRHAPAAAGAAAPAGGAGGDGALPRPGHAHGLRL